MYANIQNNARFRPKYSPTLSCRHIFELRRKSHSPIHLNNNEEKSVLPKSPCNRNIAPFKWGCSGNDRQKVVRRKEE